MGFNLGYIVNKILPIRIEGSKTLETIHHTQATASADGVVANVDGYGSIAFQVIGSFKADIIIEGSIYTNMWNQIPVVRNDGSYIETIRTAGIYKADITGYRQIRARIIYISGNPSVISNAVVGALPGDAVIQSNQNAVIYRHTDTYFLTRNKVYYGDFTRGTTDVANLRPINYKNFSKKMLVIENNTNVDLRINKLFKFIEIKDAAVKDVGTIDTQVIIPAGKSAKISHFEFPELATPFLGLTAEVQAVAESPTTGSVTVTWLGGNE